MNPRLGKRKRYNSVLDWKYNTFEDDELPAFKRRKIGPDERTFAKRNTLRHYDAPKGERKGVDTRLTQVSIVNSVTTSDDVIVVNGIAPGSGSWNRVGRAVNNHSLRIRAEWIYLMAPNKPTLSEGSQDIEAATLRMVVVFDKQPPGNGGEVPAFNNIFGTLTSNGSEDNSILDPLRYDAQERYTVLRDKIVPLNPGFSNVMNTDSVANPAAAGQVRHDYKCRTFCRGVIDEYIPLKGVRTTYGANNDTYEAITHGGIYVIFRCSNNTTGLATCSLSGNSFARLRYFDE